MQIRWIFVLVSLTVFGIGVGLLMYQRSEPVEELLDQGWRALKKRNYAQAERYASRVLSLEPGSRDALLLKGRAAGSAGKTDSALQYLEQIEDDESTRSVEARCVAGLLLQNSSRLKQAETQFRRALRQDPQNRVANEYLAHLMLVSTQFAKMVPHELALIRDGVISPRRLSLLSLSDRRTVHPDASFLQKCYSVDPDDPLVLLGRADLQISEHKYGQAERTLRRLLRTDPQCVEAQVRLGEILAAAGAESDFLVWHTSLPKSMDDHPGIWINRAAWAQQHNEMPVAIRCYAEAVRRDPAHQQANYRLGRSLESQNHSDSALFLRRSHDLQRYASAVHAINAKTDQADREIDQSLLAARLAESLGMYWESYAWFNLALKLDAVNKDAASGRSRLQTRLTSELPLRRSDPRNNPALDFDLTGFPLPQWTGDHQLDSSTGSQTRKLHRVIFDDQAEDVGVNFQYFNDNDPGIHGLTRLYQFTGGGTGVLDFDGDGWPDIYLTQGCRVETDDEKSPNSDSDTGTHFDHLFRNRGDGRFEDVTTSSGLAESGYSQGVTVGDYDSDGFPDLYVGNLGRNRQYRNNGDGTFTDVTDIAATGGDDWTTSCLMADLNGDALADVYSVNYLSGREVFDTVCRDISGERHACAPAQFPAAQDRLYLNLGDGHFRDVTTDSGIQVPEGKGLGVLAADFDGTGMLNLFIANDLVANFYFVNQTSSVGNDLRFKEQALPMGLAYNRDGYSEACMGVAAGDTDLDGQSELFVTNFYDESNTLYRRQPNGQFVDDSKRAGLGDPSVNLLGFGTQFLDGELDGALDVMITNGHVNVPNNPKVAWQMPPQYFSNRGDGEFVERRPGSVGPYFGGRYLGRGMARIDWNRDGLEDVIISHLDSPAALLSNTTTSAGHYLAVRLRGTQSNRDAIGASAIMTLGGTTLHRQLTAGDGYHASNQRLLTFGLGDHTQIDRLEIRWPSGLKVTVIDPPIDSEILLIEQHPQPFVWP